MKKAILWTGVKDSNKAAINKWRYGNYEWMDYSRKTWKYYADKINADFISFETSFNSDTLNERINWQRWLHIDKLVSDKYDKILSTDASIMVKWNCPDLFEIADNKFSALLANENLRWTYESAMGYKKLFNNFDFDIKKYIASGFIIFNKEHMSFWRNLKEFYYENKKEIIRLEDEIVKRGRDQPVINYLLQINNIEVNYLPFIYGVNHMYRYELFTNNWQMTQLEPNNEEWKIPHFIKHFYVWIFSGFPDRGDTRTNLMSDTWQIIKNNYT